MDVVRIPNSKSGRTPRKPLPAALAARQFLRVSCSSAMNFSDPVALFHSALDALNAESWNVAAEHCDPVSLRAFKRQMLLQFTPPPLERTLTVELLMRNQPDMPRAVAEYQVAEHRKNWGEPSQRLAHELPGIASIDEVSTTDPSTLFASWLQGRSPRMQVL